MPWDASNPRQQWRGCLFIEGDPKTLDWTICQAPKLEGKSWCGQHALRVYRQPSDPPDTPAHWATVIPPVEPADEQPD